MDAQTGFTHLKLDIYTKKRTKKKLQEQDQITAPDLDERNVSVYHALRGLPCKLTVMSGGPERFNPLPVGISSPNFQKRYLVSKGRCTFFSFFERSKGQRSRGQKQGFRLKSISSYSF